MLGSACWALTGVVVGGPGALKHHQLGVRCKLQTSMLQGPHSDLWACEGPQGLNTEACKRVGD